MTDPELSEARAQLAPGLVRCLERIEALERRLVMARAMAEDLRDWIEDRKGARTEKRQPRRFQREREAFHAKR